MTGNFWGFEIEKSCLYSLLATLKKNHLCCLFLPRLPHPGRRERRTLLTSSDSNPPATESVNVKNCKHELFILIFYPQFFLSTSMTTEEVSSREKCLFLEASQREISIGICVPGSFFLGNHFEWRQSNFFFSFSQHTSPC